MLFHECLCWRFNIKYGIFLTIDKLCDIGVYLISIESCILIDYSERMKIVDFNDFFLFMHCT